MATYFVDATGGSDGAAGTSEGTAWQTIAKVNGSTFTAGDSIVFKRGELWREKLTVPSSGSVGLPITFGAYGTGADPVITPTVAVTNFALPEGSGVWSAAVQTGASQGNDASPVVENFRQIIQAASISTSGSSIRLKFNGASTGSTTIQKCTIGEQHATNPEDFAGAPTTLRINGSDVSAANPITVPQSGTISTDFTTFALDETKNYLVHLWNATGFATLSRWLGATTNSYYNATSTDFSATQDYTGTGYNAINSLAEIQVESDETVKWEAAVVATPSIVLFDGVPGTQQASYAALGSPRDWYYAAGALYVYSLTDPDVTYTLIEAGAITRALEILSKAYVTVDHLELRGSNGFGLNLNNADNIVLSALTISLTASSGLNIENGSDTVLVSGCTIRENGFGPVGGDRNGISIGGLDNGSANITVTGCLLDGNWNTQIDIASTSTDAVAATVTITQCQIVNGLHGGILIGGGHTGIVVTYNIIANHAESGVMINKGTTSGNPVTTLYNNVIWGNGTAGTTNLNHGIAYSPDGNTQTLQNNIIGQSNGLEIEKGSGSTLVSDYNLWYHLAGGTFMKYHGVSYSFANWKINSGLDAASMSADPLFVDAPAHNYALQAGSPARDAGVNLGATYDDGVAPNATWPSGVSTLDQDNEGSGWDIGAYVFTSNVTVDVIGVYAQTIL